MKTTIYCPDIECDSCSRVLEKAFKQLEGIKSFNILKDRMEIDFNEEEIRSDEIIQKIKEKGYRASTEKIVKSTVKQRTKEFMNNKAKYELEHKIIKYSLVTLVVLLILEGVLAFLSRRPELIGSYGLWFVYLTVSIVAVGTAIWHIKSYRTEITSMAGMMIGMTIGMQSGLMTGAILGATNGMFIGSLTGMLVGMGVGWYMGQCCGIMGIMEGLMAGLMGGIMGPMTSVMMISDNLTFFIPIFILANIIVLIGLSYMVYEEVIETKEKIEKIPLKYTEFLSYCVLAVIILGAVILFGPKSVIVGLI